jgi:hypothetical protein
MITHLVLSIKFHEVLSKFNTFVGSKLLLKVGRNIIHGIFSVVSHGFKMWSQY